MASGVARSDSGMLVMEPRRRFALFLLGAFIVLIIADIAFFLYFVEYHVVDKYQSQSERCQEHYSLFCGPVFSFISYWSRLGWSFIDSNHDAILAAFTILIFVVTSLLARYTYRLWNETKTLREGADAVAKKQAIDTQKALDIAKRSADAARDTVAAMENTAKRQLRAYVFADSPTSNDFLSGTGVEMKVPIRNCGATPARDVRVTVVGLYWPVNAIFPSKITEARIRHGGVIAPNAVATMGVTVSKGTAENIQGIRDGTVALYLIGTIEYVDAFVENRTTHFRFVIGGSVDPKSKEMSATEGGNDYT